MVSYGGNMCAFVSFKSFIVIYIRSVLIFLVRSPNIIAFFGVSCVLSSFLSVWDFYLQKPLLPLVGDEEYRFFPLRQSFSVKNVSYRYTGQSSGSWPGTHAISSDDFLVLGGIDKL